MVPGHNKARTEYIIRGAYILRNITNSGPIYWHGLTLIPAWINNYTNSKVWDEITYTFLNFNGATVEV